MLFYWDKRIDAEQFGERVVSVQCSKCGCEYFYVLSLVGAGSATAPYAIGITGVTRIAQAQSQRDLIRRLASEAELVPCPKCNWINDELVRGYRRGRYRRLGMVAFCVGVGGTILSLIAAWFISIGPPADRVALPYLLFGGPTLWITIALGIILLRHCLRMRIQPNRDFPSAPKLPSGTPPALLRDQLRGELRAAKLEDFGACVTNDSLAFRIGRDTLPVNCCNCLQSGSAGFGHKCWVSATVELEIPRCKDCAHSVKQKYRRTWWVSVAISLLVAIAVALSLPVAEFWLIMSAAAVTSLALASFVASTATAPVKIVRRDSSRGVIRLRFRNLAYAELVAKHISDSAAARSPGLDGRLENSPEPDVPSLGAWPKVQ